MKRKITVICLIFTVIFPNLVRGEVSDRELAQLAFKEAETYELQREWAKALDWYEKAAKLDAIELYRYKAAYAATQCKPPRWDVAERQLSRNRGVDSLLLLAQINQQRGLMEQARELLQAAERQASDDPRLLRAWGRWAIARWKAENRPSDAEMAIRCYRDYLRRHPNAPDQGEIREYLRELEHGEAGRKLNMAIHVLRNDEFTRAWELLQDVEMLAPAWLEPAYWRGKICAAPSEANSRYDSTGAPSEKYWRQVVDSQNGAESLPEARLALANLYWKGENRDKALQEAVAAVEGAPGWAPPLLLLGEIYQGLGDYPRSRESFQKVVRLAPNSVEAEQAKRALEVRPPPPEALAFPRTARKLEPQKLIKEQGPEVENLHLLKRLEEILFRLYQANGSSGLLPRVRLLANKRRNAWSLPPDGLFVTIGLVEFVDSQPSLQPIADDVLAFVLGHEWTHLLQRDYERSEKIQLVLAGQVPEQSVSWVRLCSSLGRFAEITADSQGLLFAYRAGYHPYAAMAWCQATIQEDGDWEGSDDHPSLRERQYLLQDLLSGPMREAYQSFEEGVRAFAAYQRTFKVTALEEATRAFESYLRLFPNDSAALENLGIVYFLRGVSILPRTPWQPWRLEHEIQKEPELEPFPSKIITITPETRRWWERAGRQASILLRLNPDRPGAYQILGDVSLGLGERQRAEEIYQKGRAIAPAHRGLLNNLGVLHALRNDIPRARELWTSVHGSLTAAWNLKVKK